MRHGFFKILTFLASPLLVMGCAEHANQIKPKESVKIRVSKIAPRQLPPQPTYHRLRYGVTPDTKPARQLHVKETRARYMPKVSLSLKNTRLEEAITTLASTARYSSYTASEIANKRVSIESLGTLEELAIEIEDRANIAVHIDHEGKAVRAFALNPTQAGFYEEGN